MRCAARRDRATGSARPATVTPWRAYPRGLSPRPASTEQAAAVVRAAAAADLAVVVRGGGTKLDWAAPPRRLDLVIDTRRLTGVRGARRR